MTKAGGLALWAGGDHVADLDLALGYNDPRHQALNQLPLLLPRGLIQPRPYAPAERLRAQANTSEFGLAVYLRFQLAQLGVEGLPFLVQSVAPAPELVETHNTRQVSLREPLDLLLNTGLPAPSAARRACKSCGSQCPPCARPRAKRMASGSFSNRHKSSQTSASTCSAGM